MPGSPYHKIALQVSDWLSVVDECNINSSTKEISDSLQNIQLPEDHVLISFDVTSLYTNVPVLEAIEHCTNLLYSGKYKKPPVDRNTFEELLKMCSSNVVMQTNDGYFRQVDGLAMGSPPAPRLANGWLSKYDAEVKGDAELFSRYMDDILRDIKKNEIKGKLVEINNIHPSLEFTHEEENENENSIAFLDMKITRSNGTLSSMWYTKPTDTGLTMNFHAVAPLKYKKSVVSGFVHRIFRACSSWENFHTSLTKAITILQNNQYPLPFIEPIIKRTIESIVTKPGEETTTEEDEEEKKEEKMIFVQYRGKLSEKFEGALKRLDAPCKVIFTLRKLKTCLPSLKPHVDVSLRSKVVYKIKCPCCNACYVGQTSRHLLCRVREHKRRSSPVGSHFVACNTELTMENVKIIASTLKSITYLMTLEALFINDIKPSLNTKDEYRSRTLVIKF